MKNHNNEQVLEETTLNVSQAEQKAEVVKKLKNFLDMGATSIVEGKEAIKNKRTSCSFNKDYSNAVVDAILKVPEFKDYSFEVVKLSLKAWFEQAIRENVAFALGVTEASAQGLKQ